MAAANGIKVGGLLSLFDSLPSFSTFTLNGATDQLEFIFAVANDGDGNITITKVGFRYGLRTGTPPTFKISLQGVDGSGVPDGTIKGGASPASATFTPPADATWNSTWQWVTLDNAYTAAPGEMLALVIAYSGVGTIDASNNSSFTTVVSNSSSHKPYAITNDAGVRSVVSPTNTPIFGYASASKAYGRPLQTITTITYTSASNPNEYGAKFTLPAGWGDTFKVGWVNFLAVPAAAGTILLQLYSGGAAADTTVLQDVQHDTDHQGANTGGRRLTLPFDEASLSSLTFGNSYRTSLLAQTATNVVLYQLEVASASDWDAWPGAQDFALSTRNGGNWTDTATKRLIVDVVLADITEPAGGAGMLYIPNLAGT